MSYRNLYFDEKSAEKPFCRGLLTLNIVAHYGDALLEHQTNPPASEPHLSTQWLWIHKGCDCQASVQLEYKGNNM